MMTAPAKKSKQVTDESFATVKQLYAHKLPVKDISKLTGHGRSTINKMVHFDTKAEYDQWRSKDWEKQKRKKEERAMPTIEQLVLEAAHEPTEKELLAQILDELRKLTRGL